MRWPMGFSPPKYALASVSLMTATGGALYLNASNFPSVFNVQFVNWGGTAVFVEGDNNYLDRLNHISQRVTRIASTRSWRNKPTH
mgnify:CR=1 FL=1